MLQELRHSIGRASQVIPNVGNDFEQACLWVAIEGFHQMKKKNSYSLTWKETRFSAHLIGFMRKVRDENDIGLRIDPENYLYRDEILEGLQDPDTAPRIDIKVSGNWVHEDIYYGIEAKILVENDWKTRDNYKLRRRYIETGIDNFVSGRYLPEINNSDKICRGCILGYVIEGVALHIALKINQLLVNYRRKDENLFPHNSINDCPDIYHSTHICKINSKRVNLFHIFLNFC